MDYFGARYYDSVAGRFASPDPLLSSAKYADSQTWSRYSYGLGNALRFVDIWGLKVQVADDLALEFIKATLPEELRKYVEIDKNGFISSASLNGVVTDNANFNALRDLVNSDQTSRVLTSPRTTLTDGKQTLTLATPAPTESVPTTVDSPSDTPSMP